MQNSGPERNLEGSAMRFDSSFHVFVVNGIVTHVRVRLGPFLCHLSGWRGISQRTTHKYVRPARTDAAKQRMNGLRGYGDYQHFVIFRLPLLLVQSRSFSVTTLWYSNGFKCRIFFLVLEHQNLYLSALGP